MHAPRIQVHVHPQTPTHTHTHAHTYNICCVCIYIYISLQKQRMSIYISMYVRMYVCMFVDRRGTYLCGRAHVPVRVFIRISLALDSGTPPFLHAECSSTGRYWLAAQVSGRLAFPIRSWLRLVGLGGWRVSSTRFGDQACENTAPFKIAEIL